MEELYSYISSHKVIKQLGLETKKGSIGETHVKALLDYIDTLTSHCKQLYDSDSCDVKFVVGDKVVRAHSSIVSSWSVLLQTMLQSPMREGTTKTIEIQTESYSSVKAMVEYLYTTQINLDQNNALPLLRLSSYYDIASLTYCIQYLQSNITAQNCMQVFVEATRHKIEKSALWDNLEKRSIAFMKSKALEVLRASNNPFLGLDSNELVQVLDAMKLGRRGSFFNRGVRYEEVAPYFIQWAKRTMQVNDFCECLAVLDNQRNSPDLFKKICYEAIEHYFELESQSNGFLKLSLTTLCTILKTDDLCVDNELVVLSAVVKWVNNERTNDLPQLLELVRFPFIPPDKLLTLHTIFPVLVQCNALKPLLKEALQIQMENAAQKRFVGQDFLPSKNNIRTKKRNSYSTFPTLEHDHIINAFVNNLVL